ncbi:hypothetical protein ACFLXP_03570 [Chloroflexota bacterium]
MKEEYKSQLDSLMNGYDKRLEQEKEQEVLRKNQAGDDSSDFVKIIKNTIYPVMDEMGNKLREHGHKFSTHEQPKNINRHGREKKETVTMKIYRAGKLLPGERNNRPEIYFFKPYEDFDKVEVHQLVHGSGGLIRSININQIDKETVEELILQFIKDTFDREL